MYEGYSRQFGVAVVKQFLLMSVFLSVKIVVFFISSGYLIDPRSWFYFVTAFVHYVVSITVQFKLNPELLVQRLKKKEERDPNCGTKYSCD
jgi:hypothetical protein